MERMGFEQDKRVVKVMGNRPCIEFVGGKEWHFDSQLEYKWAQYLEFLKQAEKIRDWDFHCWPEPFYFIGVKKAPVQYTPDFLVTENDGTEVIQELKGHHDGPTNSKLARMAEYYPDKIMELVLQSIPKGSKGANRRHTAKKYTRRIIDASVIFRQMGALIK
jgi:hypothetical protein